MTRRTNGGLAPRRWQRDPQAERELLALESQPLDHAIFDQRPRLEGFRGGTPEGGVRGVAGLGDESPVGIDDGHVDAVAGFENRPPVQLNEHPTPITRNAELGTRNRLLGSTM